MLSVNAYAEIIGTKIKEIAEDYSLLLGDKFKKV